MRKKQDFRQCIGEYECHIYGHSCFSQFTNERIYEATIKYYDYDGSKLIFESRISCFPDDCYHLHIWYENVKSKINEKWKEYIFKKYFDEIDDSVLWHQEPPSVSGEYLCTCHVNNGDYRYLHIMEYNADKKYWHDVGRPNATSHKVLAWTKINVLKF